LRLEDTEDFVTGDETDLGDTVRVTEGDTDLGGGKAFPGELDDVVDNVLWGCLKPRRGSAAVRESRGRCMIRGKISNSIVKGKRIAYKCPCRERAYDPYLIIS
jgi:hypothetical protein